jgi:hypothetical protein
MRRYLGVTHVTLEVGDMTLHVDHKKANWYPSKNLEKIYNDKLTRVNTVFVGTTTRDSYPQPRGPFGTLETIVWWYTLRKWLPSYRPNGCAKEVRVAAEYYGWELPNTAVPDELFISSEDYKCK